MLQQVSNAPPYDKNLTGGPQFRNWMELLCAFNHQLSQGPVWLYDTPGQQGLIGFPFNALLNWSMSTPAGLLAFHRPDVNAHLCDILSAYGEFLTTPASTFVLNSSPTGWLNPTALDAIASTACLPPTPLPVALDATASSFSPKPESTPKATRPKFHELFISDLHHTTHGFSSWDAFFTRQFRPGIRPVAFPSEDSVIINACESTPLYLERDVKPHDEFWLKGQPYSLVTMLGGNDLRIDEDADRNEMAEIMRFEGGTVYQGFLGALSYHRWHASVAGVVERVRKIQGTYFAGCPGLASRENGEKERTLDPSAPDRSQRYLCQVGTRALVYIRARDRRLGTVVFVAVGMAEVSSCEVTVREGDMVEKGEEIGMFHYGGSTHCLIFEPGVRLKFTEAAEGVDVKRRGHNLPVNGYLAEVVSG
ncbi:hypothetical protein N0V85_007807 [Neurospora sp. IMI 360204]|nr:hypothetical protein N0V85_007807 [Neurospora sp. IMI 360204]